MDEQTGKEVAELIGWILGGEWRVSWAGVGVIVQPASATKKQLRESPCMTFALASKPDSDHICSMIDDAVMRRADVTGVTIRKLRIGDVHYKIKRTKMGMGDCDPNGYEKRELDARLATLRLLREADDG